MAVLTVTSVHYKFNLVCVLFNSHPIYIHSHLGILDKMHHQQSSIDALHGQMTSQLNIDPALLSGVSCVMSVMLLVIVTCLLIVYYVQENCLPQLWL